MAKTMYEVAFELAGKLNGSFGAAFSSANKKLEQTRKNAEALNKGKINPTARLNDKLSAPLGKLESRLKTISNKTISITLKAKDAASNAISKLTSPLGIAGGILAPAYFVGTSIGKAMDFEAQMSSIKALTGANTEEMAAMQQLALAMGAKTKYSALESAKGIEELLKAGLKPATVQAGGLEAALNLATAGGLDLADAAIIMSTSLNAYKADALTAADASNILAGTANASATSVKDLQESLSMVSAVASGVGMTLRDTNIALGLFANNGLRGSDAGTSLKTMLMNLQPATKEQEAAFRKLGIVTGSNTNKFFTAEGKLRSLTDITQVVQESFAGMTDQQRMATMEVLFGSDAIRAANILYKEGTKGVKEFTDAMGKVTALDVAREKMNNAAGEVEQFRGAIETLQISALMPLMPTLKRIANAAAEMAVKITPTVQQAGEKIINHFNQIFNNPKFQQADFGGKLAIVLNDALTSLKKWLDGPGGTKIAEVTNKLGAIMAQCMTALLPIMIPVFQAIGTAIGKAIVEGIKGAVKGALSDPQWLMESAGTLWKWSNPGGAIGTVPGTVYDIATNVSKSMANGQTTQNSGSATLPFVTENSKYFPHAFGGVMTRPHLGLVAEAGPEVIIPLSSRMRSRALNLYQKAGRYLGVQNYAQGGLAGYIASIDRDTTTVNVNSSNKSGNPHNLSIQVIIDGGSPDIQKQAEQGVRAGLSAFGDMLSEWTRQEERVSYG